MLEGTDSASGVLTMKGVELYGLKEMSRIHLRTPTFSFNIRGVHPKKVAEYMWDRHGLVVIGDDFYSRALKTYGRSLAVRAGLVHCNTIEEVETFLSGLDETTRHFNAA
jgi:selenocysteine lyase/cysteine desulfurase